MYHLFFAFEGRAWLLSVKELLLDQCAAGVASYTFIGFDRSPVMQMPAIRGKGAQNAIIYGSCQACEFIIRHYYSAKFFVNIQGIIYCGFLGVEQPLFAHAEHRESVVDVYIRIRTPCSLHCHCLRQRSYHHDTYSADTFCL